MNDRPHGEGGAANTPPFPRMEPLPVEPELEEPAEVRAESANADPDGDTEPDSAAEPDFSDSEPVDGPEFDGSDPETIGEPPPFGARARERIGRTARSGLNRGFAQIADRLDEAAERIERLAEDRLRGTGPQQRAAHAAQSTAERLGGISDYFRDSDLDEIRADLERQVREKPLLTLFLAAGTGWLLGRIIR